MRAMIMLTVMTGQCHDNHVDAVHIGDEMTFQWQRTLASCRAGLLGARVRPRRSKSTWIIIIVKMFAIAFGGEQRWRWCVWDNVDRPANTANAIRLQLLLQGQYLVIMDLLLILTIFVTTDVYALLQSPSKKLQPKCSRTNGLVDGWMGGSQRLFEQC